MAFIGNQPVEQYSTIAKQDITGNGGTSYTLNASVTSPEDIELFINNVRQEPTTSYSVTGTALTLTEALASTDDCYVVFQGRTVGTKAVPVDGVSTGNIQANAVTTAKINTDAVTSAKIAANAVGSSEIDLTANYTYTGNVIQPSGWQLLSTYDNESSPVNMDPDTLIHNWGNHVSDFRTFMIIGSGFNVSDGSYHMYATWRMANSNQPMMQGNIRGFNHANGVNTPYAGGVGAWSRFAYRHSNNPGPFSYMFQVVNGASGGAANTQRNIVHVTSTWLYHNTGTAHATGVLHSTTQNDSPIAKFMINVDQSGYGEASSSRTVQLKSYCWGLR